MNARMYALGTLTRACRVAAKLAVGRAYLCLDLRRCRRAEAFGAIIVEAACQSAGLRPRLQAGH